MPDNKPLTTLKIKAMKVGATLSDAADHRGLRVTRNQGDYRYWYRFRCPETGKLTEMTILKGGHRSLAEARMVHAQLKEQRARGRLPELPKEYRKPKPAPVAASDEEGPTVEDIVVLYLKEAIYKRRKLKGAKETDRILSRCVVDHIGTLPADQVTRRDVVDLIRRETNKGHHTQAGPLLA